MLICPTCGERVEDFHPTVTRVVKKHQIFAGKNGGQRVLVEERHLAHQSVLNATVSVEQWEEMEAARKGPPIPTGPTSVELARQNMELARATWLREKAQMQYQEQRAIERATAEAIQASKTN